MDDEPWHVRRRRELEASTPVKRKKVEPFVMVPLWWIELATKATRSPTTMVLIELLYASWRAKRRTFPLPNSRLRRLGVNRETKRRVLRALEQEGLIKVDRRGRKTPTVTLLLLPPVTLA